MRVLLLTQYLSDSKGGGEHVMSMIARMIARSGGRVWVVCSRVEGESYPDVPGVSVEFAGPAIGYEAGLPTGMAQNAAYVLGAVRRGRAIARGGLDIIHSNNFAPAAAGALLSRMTGVPHVTAVHDVFSRCGEEYWERWRRQKGVSRLGAALAPRFEKMMLRARHAAIHVPSEATADDVRAMGARSPVHVVPNTIDPGPGRLASAGGGGPASFVYVGRLVFYKNVETIIRATAIARKENPAVTLRVIGGGPQREALEREAGEGVEFSGYLDNDQKYAAIKGSAALLLPSTCEGFGLVLLDAFSCGVPVLVSDVEPLPTVAGGGGMALPHGDTDAWASAMLELASDPARASRMGAEGAKRLSSEYSEGRASAALMRMYSGAAGQARL